jgi:hypothetical protein
MKYRYYFVRFTELIICFLSFYLATQSFLNSSLYEIFRLFFQGLLELTQLHVVISVNMEATLPLLMSGILMLYAVYNSLMGTQKNVLNLYNLNTFLFFPELLSFSKLYWLALIGIPNLFTRHRDYLTVLSTGLIIMGGYVMLILGSRFKENVREMEKRGIDQEAIDKVYLYQSSFSLLTVSASLATVTFISFIIPVLKEQIHKLTSTLPHAYTILGIVTTVLSTSTLAIFLRDRLHSQIAKVTPAR